MSLTRTEPGADTDAAMLRADLHPAADPVRIQVAPGGRLTVSGATGEAGPGYHTWLCHLFRRLGTELSIDWSPANGDGASRDDTGFFWSDNRADVERVHLVRLRDALRRAADAAALGRSTHMGAFEGHRFAADAALVTALGPRDGEWLAEALERPAVATDVWPWVADARDGRYLLNRARCLLWTEVRWRAPATERERAVLDETLRLLRRAFPLDPALPYPWREWREILQLAGVATDPMTERIVREADALDADGAAGRIGYRRAEVAVEHAGWTLTVPGSWAERRTDEEWWGGEAGRAITLAGVETGEDDTPMPARAFLDLVAKDLGTDALTYEDGPLLGRARIAVDASSGIEVATLDGFSAVPGRGAAIRVEIHDPADWEWAIDMWRSLAPAPTT